MTKSQTVQLNLLLKNYPQSLKWNVIMIEKKYLDKCGSMTLWRRFIYKNLKNTLGIHYNYGKI